MLRELRELFEYNRWANERVLASCEPLAPEQLTRELGGSYPSVWLTLTHIYGAENSWLARWTGTPEGRRPVLDGITSVEQLRGLWSSLWDAQFACLSNIDMEQLRAKIPIRLWSGVAFEQELDRTMRHAVNHSTYHRGQITNYLRQLGQPAVATDLVIYYLELTKRSDTESIQ